jgi:hypothetical protein
MRSHVDAAAGREVDRPHVIEEDERADRASMIVAISGLASDREHAGSTAGHTVIAGPPRVVRS